MGLLVCPICRKELLKEGRSYKCRNNHNYDMAKQGYLNLLLASKKKSKNPGDDREMVESRKRFLEGGFYRKISEKVNETILDISDNEKEIKILDIGCGEGYYTNRLKNCLEKEGKIVEIVGIDISKEAVMAASKSYKGIFWCVASGGELPIEDRSLDFVLCMFSRIVPEEYSRVIRDDEYLVIASTGEEHLLEMKHVLYKDVKTDFYRPEKHLTDFFELEDTVNIKYTEIIRGKDNIKSLFDMTPYKWRSPKEGVARLYLLEELSVTIDVNLDIFRKKI
ncbi:putative RNA methyltransferase [uncultured Ilyobacter sp.]|uniref:putative RNA methyltransferase n=1 Tax=uncultured Ilyobacter sp. TaxID=544433 RepID=UPI0029C8F8ED|nr:methyltransferase domain-containing protein [uncultured Ilyobacter sp.]